MGLGDLPRAKAARTNPDLLDTLGRLGFNVLEVGLPLLRRRLVRVADVMPENGPFLADFAYFRHLVLSLKVLLYHNTGPPATRGHVLFKIADRTCVGIPGITRSRRHRLRRNQPIGNFGRKMNR